MDQINQISHLGRPVDPRYPTNRAIGIWSVLVIVGVFGFRLVSGLDFVQAGISAVLAGLTVFVVWAFSREIDPQEQLSAFVAVVLMTIAVVVLDVRFNLIIIFYTMSLARVVNRSVGLPISLLDSIFVLVGTGIIAFWGSWIYAMMGATVFLLDSILPDRDRKHLLFAGISMVIMVVAFVVQNSGFNPILPTTPYIIAILVATFIFIPVIMKSKHVEVICDLTDKLMLPIRVQAAQVIVLLFGYHIALWQGDAGIIEMLPLWLSIVGVALFPLIKPFVPNWDLSPRSDDSKVK